MKKLITIILLLTLTLTLSACSELDNFPDSPHYYMTEDEKELIGGLMVCYDSNFDEPECYEIDDARFYTQEEVDEIVQVQKDEYEWLEDLVGELANGIESNDGYIENTYVSHNELESVLQGLAQFIDDNDDELLQRIEELESNRFNDELRISILQREVKSLEIMIDILNKTEYNTTESQCEYMEEIVCYNDNFYYQIIDNDNIHLIFGVYNEYAIHMWLERIDNYDFFTVAIGLEYDGDTMFEEYYEVYDTTHYSNTAVSLIQDIIEDSDWEYFIEGTYQEIWEELKVQVGVE